MPPKELLQSLFSSPWGIGALGIVFAGHLVNVVVVPMVHVVTDIIPAKMETIIDKQDAMIVKLNECLSHNLTANAGKGGRHVR